MSEGAPDPLPGRAVILEFITVGDALRVAAVDEATGVEVAVVCPVNTAREDAERLATRKLRRRLEALGHVQPDPDTKTPRPGGRGVVI